MKAVSKHLLQSKRTSNPQLSQIVIRCSNKDSHFPSRSLSRAPFGLLTFTAALFKDFFVFFFWQHTILLNHPVKTHCLASPSGWNIFLFIFTFIYFLRTGKATDDGLDTFSHGGKALHRLCGQNEFVIAMLRKIYDYFSRAFHCFFPFQKTPTFTFSHEMILAFHGVCSFFLWVVKMLPQMLLRKCQVLSDINFH